MLSSEYCIVSGCYWYIRSVAIEHSPLHHQETLAVQNESNGRFFRNKSIRPKRIGKLILSHELECTS